MADFVRQFQDDFVAVVVVFVAAVAIVESLAVAAAASSSSSCSARAIRIHNAFSSVACASHLAAAFALLALS